MNPSKLVQMLLSLLSRGRGDSCSTNGHPLKIASHAEIESGPAAVLARVEEPSEQ